MDYENCPRYDKHELDDEQIDQIAERAARKAVELARNDLYQDVGHSVLTVIKYGLGVAAVGLFVMLVKMGWIKG